MATIDVGGGSRKRKQVDGEIPLIPFIDLLLCCVMFLLVTAVWNSLGGLGTAGGRADDPTLPFETEPDILLVQIGPAGYVLSTPVGDREEIPMAGDGYDVVALRDRLEERRRLSDPSVRIIPDDEVRHEYLIATRDAVFGAGMSNVAVGSL